MKHSIIFVGLDVHKDSITIALADDGRDGEVRLYGSIGGDAGTSTGTSYSPLVKSKSSSLKFQ